MDNRVRSFFATMIQVSPDEVSHESIPNDFARWDSMQHLILIGSAEEEFDVIIDPDEIVDMFDSYRSFEQTILTKLPK